MDEIKKTLDVLKKAFAAFWGLAIVIVVVHEIYDGETGLVADNVKIVYWMETVSILLTVINVPLALKLFALVLRKKIDQVPLVEALRLYKRWSLIRLLLLSIPVLAGLTTYYMCMSTTGLLCAAIGLTASLFCVPTEQRLKADLMIE